MELTIIIHWPLLLQRSWGSDSARPKRAGLLFAIFRSQLVHTEAANQWVYDLEDVAEASDQDFTDMKWRFKAGKQHR